MLEIDTNEFAIFAEEDVPEIGRAQFSAAEETDGPDIIPEAEASDDEIVLNSGETLELTEMETEESESDSDRDPITGETTAEETEDTSESEENISDSSQETEGETTAENGDDPLTNPAGDESEEVEESEELEESEAVEESDSEEPTEDESQDTEETEEEETPITPILNVNPSLNPALDLAIDDLVAFIPANDQILSPTDTTIDNNPEANDQFGKVLAKGDFNGDGYEDLAVGLPDEDVNGKTKAGAVQVFYGSFSGLRRDTEKNWHQDEPGMVSLAQAYDRFGSSLAVGDFNGDGKDDLAIGVPGEDIGTIRDAGAVHVMLGSSNGLTAIGDRLWHQNTPGIVDSAETYDNFGSSVTAGDFDGDGKDDLAIGVPYEDIGSANNAGAVNVIYGSNGGLTTIADEFWHQNSFSILDTSENYDQFGTSLTANDFDGDGKDDLAIGIPGEDIGSVNSAGAVSVLYGIAGGLSGSRDQFWHQNSPGILDTAENYDNFGRSLTSGDYNGDGKGDLAVGIPYEDIGNITNAGAVSVLYGASNALSSIDQFWHQNSWGVRGTADAYDSFSYSLTSGDFDNDGYDDLGVGVPYEDVGGLSNAGAVNILPGSRNYITSKNDRLITQNTADFTDESAEAWDNFGFSIVAGDFNRDRHDDLAVGVPYEDRDNSGGTQVNNVGAVNVLYDA